MSDDPNTQKLLSKIALLQGEVDQLGLNVSRVRVEAAQIRVALAALADAVTNFMVVTPARFDRIDQELAETHTSVKTAAERIR